MKINLRKKISLTLIPIMCIYTLIPSLGQDSPGGVIPYTGAVKSGGGLNLLDNPFMYCGYYHDFESGLNYCKARYYSTELMSWISRDTWAVTNRYAYCYGSPVANKDTEGHDADSNDEGIMLMWHLLGFEILGIIAGAIAVGIIKKIKKNQEHEQSIFADLYGKCQQAKSMYENSRNDCQAFTNFCTAYDKFQEFVRPRTDTFQYGHLKDRNAEATKMIKEGNQLLQSNGRRLQRPTAPTSTQCQGDAARWNINGQPPRPSAPPSTECRNDQVMQEGYFQTARTSPESTVPGFFPGSARQHFRLK